MTENPEPRSGDNAAEPELDLLLHTVDPDAPIRLRAAVIGALVYHVVLLTALFTIESDTRYYVYPERERPVAVTKLYIPPDITQKAPNKAPISKELIAEAIAARPLLKSPAPAPAARAAAPPAAQPVASAPPPPQVAKAPPKPEFMEPPKIQSPVIAAPPPAVAPAPVAQEGPKIVFEEALPPQRQTATGRGTGAIAMPGNSVQEAVRSLSRGAPLGSQTVGDIGADEGGSGPGLNLPPSAGRPRSSLELKSDPMGVDFRPYMLQVLAAIRRNWFAVYPEAARLGQRGSVALQFAVAKQGSVTKVVFSGQSNAKALDQAAVAAISASNPLPPLPAEFKGDRIVLQMTFLYNMPR